MNEMLKFVLCVFLLTSALVGCGAGQRPFLVMEVCLTNDADVAAFKQELHAIAQNENMRLIDGSASTERELNALGVASPGTIHVAVERDDGMGLTAGNTGLPGYEVAVGFSEGADPSEARAFAKRVGQRLAESWTVETVPAGEGANGMMNCSPAQRP